jgi:hypothetical protein
MRRIPGTTRSVLPWVARRYRVPYQEWGRARAAFDRFIDRNDSAGRAGVAVR